MSTHKDLGESDRIQYKPRLDTSSVIAQRLILRGRKLEQGPAEIVDVTGDKEANRILNNLEDHPHLFVLGCVMDQQIKAERAWMIPVYVVREIGTAEFETFSQITPEWLSQFFNERSLHRFNDKMARWFHAATQHIQVVYGGNAARIWNDVPSSATVVRRFLRFEGIGIKIATMAANILCREHKVPMSDRVSIDISPDRHVKRVFHRLGLTFDESDENDLIYAAREISPQYPGILDFGAFELGRNWCHESVPVCNACYMHDICPKVGAAVCK